MNLDWVKGVVRGWEEEREGMVKVGVDEELRDRVRVKDISFGNSEIVVEEEDRCCVVGFFNEYMSLVV